MKKKPVPILPPPPPPTFAEYLAGYLYELTRLPKQQAEAMLLATVIAGIDAPAASRAAISELRRRGYEVVDDLF